MIIKFNTEDLKALSPYEIFVWHIVKELETMDYTLIGSIINQKKDTVYRHIKSLRDKGFLNQESKNNEAMIKNKSILKGDSTNTLYADDKGHLIYDFGFCDRYLLTEELEMLINVCNQTLKYYKENHIEDELIESKNIERLDMLHEKMNSKNTK